MALELEEENSFEWVFSYFPSVLLLAFHDKSSLSLSLSLSYPGFFLFLKAFPPIFLPLSPSFAVCFHAASAGVIIIVVLPPRFLFLFNKNLKHRNTNELVSRYENTMERGKTTLPCSPSPVLFFHSDMSLPGRRRDPIAAQGPRLVQRHIRDVHLLRTREDIPSREERVRTSVEVQFAGMDRNFVVVSSLSRSRTILET